jgi:hypothetical protein
MSRRDRKGAMTFSRVALHASTSSLVLGLSVTSLFSACGDGASDKKPSSGTDDSTASDGDDDTGGSSNNARDAAAAPDGASPGTSGAIKTDSGRPGSKVDASSSAPEAGAPTSGERSKGDGGAAGDAGGSTDGPAEEGSSSDDCVVKPITADMRSHYEEMTDPYYTKQASTSGGIIVGTGAMVQDEAIVRYCRLLAEMWSNEKVREPALSKAMWFTMIGQKEQLSSLPQINKQYGTSLNQRARGLGELTPTICAEDSIMCMKGDPWVGDCICPHETGHTLWGSGIALNPELKARLVKITADVKASGRLANAYVWMDGNESGMMSWGTQAWYDCAINGTKGDYHTDINTRAEIKTELPDFYQILSEILPVDNKYKDCYAK